MRKSLSLFFGFLAFGLSAFAMGSNSAVVTERIRVSSGGDRTEISGQRLATIRDDDIQRHAGDVDYFKHIQIDERIVSENGFVWHLLRFKSTTKPVGPLWMVPHDDENAAFEGAIAALKQHGGVAVVVNSGPGSARRQAGKGTCGVRADVVTSCDPNRNFAASSPKFTDSFLSQRPTGQPVIALHTNSPGFSGDGRGGNGEITMLDVAAFKRGKIQPRSGGYFAMKPTADMANYDTLALTAYLAQNDKPAVPAIACRNAMTKAGVHFWHERVGQSDGSMSNYLTIKYPDIAYLNAESRLEPNLDVASKRHQLMVAAYLKGCAKSWNQPVP